MKLMIFWSTITLLRYTSLEFRLSINFLSFGGLTLNTLAGKVFQSFVKECNLQHLFSSAWRLCWSVLRYRICSFILSQIPAKVFDPRSPALLLLPCIVSHPISFTFSYLYEINDLFLHPFYGFYLIYFSFFPLAGVLKIYKPCLLLCISVFESSHYKVESIPCLPCSIFTCSC